MKYFKLSYRFVKFWNVFTVLQTTFVYRNKTIWLCSLTVYLNWRRVFLFSFLSFFCPPFHCVYAVEGSQETSKSRERLCIGKAQPWKCTLNVLWSYSGKNSYSKWNCVPLNLLVCGVETRFRILIIITLAGYSFSLSLSLSLSLPIPKHTFHVIFSLPFLSF